MGDTLPGAACRPKEADIRCEKGWHSDRKSGYHPFCDIPQAVQTAEGDRKIYFSRLNTLALGISPTD